jgi:hypothetical protein
MPIRLTPELEAQILASIRSGGYPHVAAAAWGVPEALWAEWRRRGTSKHARSVFKDFFLKVERAMGQARLKAEIDALKADARFWLKHGPGREQGGNPGWAALARPTPPTSAAALDVFASPEVLQLLAVVRTALAPHPEALAMVTGAIAEAKKRGVE